MADPGASAPPRARGSLIEVLRGWLKGRGWAREGEGSLREALGELIEETDGTEAAIEPQERALLINILKLHDLTAADAMVPRADIVAVENKLQYPELLAVIAKEAHSRLPVHRGSLDDVIGMVHIKDVLAFWDRPAAFSMDKVLRPVLFIAPSMGVLDLLLNMRATRRHLALVVDEYGGIDGLLTIEDVVEQIVGEIDDEHDEVLRPAIVEGSGGVLLADGRVPLEELEARVGPLVSDEERADIDTLGGLVFTLAGRIPARGEVVTHPSGLEFEVIDADPRRIKRLRVRNLPPPSPPSAV